MTDREADQFQTILNSELNKSTIADTSIDTEDKGGGGFYVQIMTLKSFPITADYRSALQSAAAPCLILRGQYDNQPWGFTEEYLERLSNIELQVIKKAGHNILKEQPQQYYNSIFEFLRKRE